MDNIFTSYVFISILALSTKKSISTCSRKGENDIITHMIFSTAKTKLMSQNLIYSFFRFKFTIEEQAPDLLYSHWEIVKKYIFQNPRHKTRKAQVKKPEHAENIPEQLHMDKICHIPWAIQSPVAIIHGNNHTGGARARDNWIILSLQVGEFWKVSKLMEDIDQVNIIIHTIEILSDNHLIFNMVQACVIVPLVEAVFFLPLAGWGLLVFSRIIYILHPIKRVENIMYTVDQFGSEYKNRDMYETRGTIYDPSKSSMDANIHIIFKEINKEMGAFLLSI
ncbi:hypothetical protein ACJX0J_034007, partial [Zea mays]